MGEIKISSPIIVSGGGGATISGTSTLTGIYQETIAAGDPVYSLDMPAISAGQGNGDFTPGNLTKGALTIPAIANVINLTYSHNEDYLAVATNTSLLNILKRSGDTYTNLSFSHGLSDNVVDLAWTPNDEHLIVTWNDSPWISWYKRSGDTFTKLTNPPVAAQYPRAIAADPSGTYIVTCGDKTKVYKRTGDTMAVINSDLGGYGYSADWSADGLTLFVAYGAAPYIRVYTRSGDTFTEGGSIDTQPSQTGSGKLSPNGELFSFLTETGASPFLYNYTVNGTTLTKLPQMVTALTGPKFSLGAGMGYNKEGDQLIVTSDTYPHVELVYVSGTTFTKSETGIPSPPAYDASCAVMLGDHLIVGSYNTAGLHNWKTSVATPAILEDKEAVLEIHKSLLNVSEKDNDYFKSFGYATTAGIVDDIKEIVTLWEVV